MPATDVLLDEEGAKASAHRVRTRWGRQGRVNLIGTLAFKAEQEERLEYRMLEGPCRTGEVVGYLEALAEEADQSENPVVVVLDNAPFHTAGMLRDRRAGWEARGLKLYYLHRHTLPAPEPY